MDDTERPGSRVAGVVLAGGGGARLGGADKASLEVGGRTLLERALDALVETIDVVVVGDPVPTSRPVSFAMEDPRGGGPVAGLLAGIELFPRTPEWVVALAVDMPHVTPSTIRRLTGRLSRDGAQLVDADGRPQHLCAVYRTAALLLRRPRDGGQHGMAMGAFLAGLDLTRVPAVGAEARDVDTWSDVQQLRDEITGG